MNIHKNARLTLKRRIELVRMIVDQGLTVSEAACAADVSGPTARKWLGRHLAEGAAGLRDLSSRPKRSPRAIRAAQSGDGPDASGEDAAPAWVTVGGRHACEG